MKNDHIQMFYEETEELIHKLELCLVELENSPHDKEIVGETFRALHTIKGSSGMFGFNRISDFTHDIENLFDKIRSDELSVSKEIIDLTLEAIDQIKLMLNETDDKEKTFLIAAGFKKLINTDTPNEVQRIQEVEHSRNSQMEVCDLVTYKIEFVPNPDMFYYGTNPLHLIEELKGLGVAIVVAHTDKIPPLDKIDPVKVYIYWDIVLTTDACLNTIKDIFIFVEDDCKIDIKVIDEQGRLGNELYHSQIKQLLANKAEIKVENIIPNDDKTGSNSVKKNIRQAVNKTNNQSNFSSARIKVDAEKLDALVNLVGELVTVQAHLSQTVSGKNDPDLFSIGEEVERLTWSLRDNVLRMRMIPIGTMFSQFNRLVRDLSKELGKKVVLETEGAETELDKNVIESLHDPMVHIIRNCIDHGIEEPELRKSKGKSETGKIFLSAEHSGANVIIKIKDDGAGLNRESIRNKALLKELIKPDDELSEKDIYRLIFSAGFSTAKEITSVSGRGVGLDVVAKVIESLRGSTDIESKAGEGTTIILKLPLTLAIIEGLLVRIANEYFVIPLSYVEECVELTSNDIEKAHGKHLANVRGQLIPYIPLGQKFEINGIAPSIQQIVIVNENNNRTGFVVDEIIGEHQTVIKSLGKFIKNVDGISGLTILGDGKLALILDVPKLIKAAEVEEMIIIN